MQRQEGLCVSFILLFVLGLAISSAAQTETATLSGRVTDPSGAIVPGARVEVINIATNITTATETNAQGIYVVTNLRPGRYRIVVRKEGFKQVVKPGVVLNVQDIISHNFALAVGSVVQSVTVLAESGRMATSPAVSTVVDRQFVENLPLNGRSFQQLITLTPGVVIAPVGFPNTDKEAGQFSVNGQRANANYFTVDGVGANFGVSTSAITFQAGGGTTQAFSAYGGTSSLVSVDALEEFRVQTSTLAPEYGRTPGGQVSITTRSGANEFHGGIFNYFRNDKLDANDWFANAAGIPKAALRQNDFGGFLGGPIVRDKTFFFFSYEGLRLRQPQTKVVQVPSLSVRSAAVPAAAPYLDGFPRPNRPDLTSTVAEFIGSYSSESTLNATSVRIDHTFSSKVTLFGRYNYAPSSNQDREKTLNVANKFEVDTQTLTIGTTMQLTPRVTNSFRGNYSVQEGKGAKRLDSFGGAAPPDPSLLLPSPSSVTNSRAIFFPLEIGNSYELGRFSNNRTRQYNLLNDLSVTTGAHQLKFGVDYRELLFDLGGLQGNVFYFTFSLQNFAATAIADLLFNFIQKDTAMRFRAVSLYGQDTWRIGPRLTLTYGLRWESNISPRGRGGTILAAWTNVDDPANTTLAPIGTSPWKNTYGNFAPRVGVAYRVTPDGDLVVRGGYGLFYDLGTGTAPHLGAVFPNNVTGSGFGLVLPLADLTPITPVFSLDPPFPGFSEGFSRDLKLPRSHQWNIAVEKSLWGQQAISATYVGQVGRRLLRREREVQPNPDFSGVFTAIRNGDTSDYHALQIQYRRPLSQGLQALVNYTWSHSIDSNSNDFTDLASGTVISPESNRGSSSFDVRHNFSAAIHYKLPRFAKQSPLAKVTDDWSVDAVVQARTGFPFDVSTTNVAIPGVSGSTRVDLVPGEPFWIQDGSVGGGRRLNAAAFSLPPTPRQGTLGRNVIRGFDLAQVDLSLARSFGFTEKVNLQFRADFFNILNHPNFTDPAPRFSGGVLVNDRSTQTLNRGLGGLDSLYQAGGPRSIQFSLKLAF